MYFIMGSQYICQSCSYKWTSRKRWGEPSVCPHCRSNSILTAESHKEKIAWRLKKNKFEEDQRKKGLEECWEVWIPREEFNKIFWYYAVIVLGWILLIIFLFAKFSVAIIIAVLLILSHVKKNQFKQEIRRKYKKFEG